MLCSYEHLNHLLLIPLIFYHYQIYIEMYYAQSFLRKQYAILIAFRFFVKTANFYYYDLIFGCLVLFNSQSPFGKHHTYHYWIRQEICHHFFQYVIDYLNYLFNF